MSSGSGKAGKPQDAYLAALAASHGAKLATFDQALAEALPDCTELIRRARDARVIRG
jgi:predicted nucleic acid-binding protein